MQLPAIYRLMACCCACCPHRVQVSYCLPGKLCSCHRFQESSNQPFNQFSQIWVLISVKHSCLPTIFSIMFLKKYLLGRYFFLELLGCIPGTHWKDGEKGEWPKLIHLIERKERQKLCLKCTDSRMNEVLQYSFKESSLWEEEMHDLAS